MPDKQRVKEFIETHFDISRYSGCETWGAAEWGQAISGRQLIKEEIDSGRLSDAECFEGLLHSPLELDPTYWESLNDKLVLSESDLALSELQVMDVLKMQAGFEHDDRLQRARKRYKGLATEDKQRVAAKVYSETILKPIFDETGDEAFSDSPDLLEISDVFGESIFEYVGKHDAGPVAWLEVNPEASEDLAVAAFQKWFRDKRALLAQQHKVKRKERLTEADFKSWAKLRVLAYIDLSLISEATATQLTNFEIGEFLYPEEAEHDVVERVRKTTSVLAKNLMAPNTWRLLVAQVESDRAKQAL